MINMTTEYVNALGDLIDTVFLANMISVVDKTKVNLVLNNSVETIHLLNKLVNFGNVVINENLTPHNSIINTKSKDVHYNHILDKKFYYHYSKKIEKIPLNKNIEKRDINLPEKFITTQWDAGQLYRLVDRWDPDRINNIESHYKKLGFDIIKIGGQGQYKNLKDIMYIISKAKYHVGADSGMNHIAKFIIPIENIHIYINIRRRENDTRFKDGWNVAWMARELFRRGAKMNHCEYIKSHDIKGNALALNNYFLDPMNTL